MQADRPFAHPQTTRRERILLLCATGVIVVGAVILYLADPSFGRGHLMLVVLCSILSFAPVHVILSRAIPRRDPLLLPIAALLTGWGLLLVGRLAINFFLRQAIWMVVSSASFAVVVRLGGDLRWLRRFRYTWLFGGLALLAATLVLGVNPSGYGPRLWLGGFGIYFQPSELLKLLMIVYVASYLAEKRDLLVSERWRLGRWPLPPLAYIGPLLAMFGLAMIMLAWQRDLGAAMLFLFTFLAMLYLATERRLYVIVGLAFFCVVGLVSYHLSDRVALRIDGWLDPWPEASGRAFQIVQSLLAFAAGGVFGQGLGLGSPTYIPAVHTDFVFAAIGEEFGLVGTLVVVALYAVLALRGLRIAAQAPRPFERFLAAGLTTGLVVQAWVIMAGNARLAPITGVTLPFVSYGGSSLLTSYIALGLLLRVSAAAPGAPVLGASTVLSVPRSFPHASLRHLTYTICLALVLLSLTSGYWAVLRGESLRGREDDPRRVRYEQRIVRGRILDRNGAVLAGVEIAEGVVVTRTYPVPEAAPVVGYASLRYGTGGIESAFDAELRGEADRSVWQTLWQELLHRPPLGRDVQLTLDAALQVQALGALGDLAGAAVLLDATTGEVLALASSPVFDPAHLDEAWDDLRQDPSAPLVNRATQGLYQPGAALQTVIMAEALAEGAVQLSARATRPTASVTVDSVLLRCNPSPESPVTLAESYAAACPAPLARIGEHIGLAGLTKAVTRWRLTTPPSLEVPTEAGTWNPGEILTSEALRAESVGQGRLTVSPLHMALMAATLANEGVMPIPHLVYRVRDTEGRWQEAPVSGEPRLVIPREHAQALLAAWSTEEHSAIGYWGLAFAGVDSPPHAWYIGVTPYGSTRYAIAVLLEHAPDPQSATAAGVALLQAATGS